MATEVSQALDDQRLVVFRLAGEVYGLAVNTVESIGVLPTITRVPRTPGYIRGITNLRGRVVPIVDLRRRMRLPEAKHTADTRVVVVEHQGEQIGLLVDAVTEIRPVDAATIEPPSPLIVDVGTEYISGVIKAAECLIIVLDLQKVLRREDRERRDRVS